MTNRDQEDETNKGGNEAAFSSDFSKVPAEVGKDAGVLQPFDVHALEGLRTTTRTGGKMEAKVSFADRGEQHIEVQGFVQENGQPTGSWEYSYLERSDGKLETAGCTISTGGSIEKWKRHFDQTGHVSSETDEVDGKKRKEAFFSRDSSGRVVKVLESEYDENGVKMVERVDMVDSGGKHVKSTTTSFDNSGMETGRQEFSPIDKNQQRDLERRGVFTSTLKLGAGGNKNFERV